MDWFTERMNLDYNNENLAELPHQEYLRRLEGRIMMFVSSAEDGIGHLELSRKLKIDRKNLTPHLKRLMKKGLVRRGNGKRGKYFPASKKYRGASIIADIFSQAVISTILKNEDFPINSPHFEAGIVDNDDVLDISLFKFSNVVGAIVTYLIIQSMDRSNEILGRDAKNPRERDINVNRWFNDGLSTLGTYLLASFKKYTTGGILELPDDDYLKEDGTPDLERCTADFWRYRNTMPLFALDEKYIKSLVTSFRRTYPSIGVQLEKIRSHLPNLVNLKAARDEYRRIRDKQQKICKHEFKPPIDTFFSAKNEFMHCPKCHKTKRKFF